MIHNTSMTPQLAAVPVLVPLVHGSKPAKVSDPSEHSVCIQWARLGAERVRVEGSATSTVTPTHAYIQQQTSNACCLRAPRVPRRCSAVWSAQWRWGEQLRRGGGAAHVGMSQSRTDTDLMEWE